MAVRMSKWMKIIVCLICMPILLKGQLPKSDIYLATFTKVEQKVIIRDVTFLNSFNKDGYNNQPTFIDNNRIYITSNLFENDQTDIVQLNVSSFELLPITHTVATSEYSPQPKPNSDYISTVRVEKDKTTQSLWMYPKTRQSRGYRLLRDKGNIGYYKWISDSEVMLFSLPEPFTLSMVDVSTEDEQVILDQIGRSFQVTANGEVLFVHKIMDNAILKSYNPDTGSISLLARLPGSSEDIAIFPDGTICIGDGGNLLYLDATMSWKTLCDFSEYGINNISRIAISNGKMVIVNNK